MPLLPGRAFLPDDVLWVDLVASFAAQAAVLAVLATLVLAGARRWLRAVAFALLLVPDGYSLGRALADPPAVGPAIATVGPTAGGSVSARPSE